MRLKYLVRTAGLSALAAAIAVAAVPSGASARDNGWSQGHSDSARSNSHASRGENRPAARAATRGPAAVQAEQRAAAPARSFAQRNFRQQGSRDPVRTVEQTNRAVPNRTYGSADRNRTYADAGRNRTYENRTVSRTAERSDGNRGRDGYRGRGYDSNRHYDGNRRYDGGRYDGHNDRGRWSNNWRNDNRYDWHDYRNSHRTVFHLGSYYSPYSSWRYRPLSIGFRLQPLFYSSRYWIDDPWQYRLPDAYGSYRWVRYYDDALLVDTYTGEVVDVIHDFFW